MKQRKLGRGRVGVHLRVSPSVRRAAARVAERLEARTMLSGGLTVVPPPGLSAVTVGGRVDLAVTPVAGVSTPDYVELDADPSATPAGTLAPFATAAATGFTPARMRHAYGVDAVTFGSVQGDGTGQTIAIVDAYDDPTATADLHSFDLAFDLPDPPSFTKVNQTGGTALPGVDPAGKGDDWEVEEALDVEWAHAMAPAASLLLVEAASATDANLITAAAGYARTVPGVVAVSMSFGRSEGATDLSLDPTFTTPAGHAGVTFLASTGDTAAPAGYPAYSPDVVAVGGTTLTADAAGDYVSEAGWADGGGGVSAYEPQPAYQKGVVTQSATYRTAPDVSFDADPNTGASIYDTYDFGTATPWLTVGGTSLAAPSVAGLVAVADQGRTLAGGAPLDGVADTLPKLYGLPAATFHDVTSGNNGFAAGVGYDLVTGRGSPLANQLLPRLAAAGPYVVAATPTGVVAAPPASVTFTFSGPMDPASFDPTADVDAFTGPGGADDRAAITGYAWTSTTTLQVNLALPAADGAYALTVGPNILSAGGDVPMDQNQNGVPGEAADADTVTFAVDPDPLAVTATTPAAGGLLVGPAPSVSVRFNQPVDPATVSPSDLTLSQGRATAATVSADGTTVTFALAGLTADGAVTATVAAGAVAKPDGNALPAAFTAAYVADLPTLPLPTPFTALAPAGSLAYAAPAVADAVYAPGDAHAYTVALAAGQQLSAAVTAAAGLQASVSVAGPDGTVLATAAAAAAGQPAAVTAVPVATAGTYTVTVGGVGAAVGAYSLAVMLDAVPEQQSVGGPAHATTATAQGLDAAFTSVGGAGRRAAVVGAIRPAGGATAQSLLSDTFESGLGGFTLNNAVAGGLWHLSTGRGAQAGHSASTSLYFGTGETAAGGGTYNTGARAAGYATMPAVTLPASPAASVSFDYVLQTEGSVNYDKAQLQVSTDEGTTFATLASYNAVAESSVWKAASASLAAYAGRSVVLRWSFDTVDATANAYEGWYVDDVSVTAGATAPPAPAVYAFTLAAGDTASLALKATAGTTTAPDVKLLDPAGNVIAQDATAAPGVDRSVADFTAPAAGTYYAVVTGTVGAGYDLAVTADATFDTAAGVGFTAAEPVAARPVGGDQRVVGHLAAKQADTYAVTLAAGATLSVSTTTPGDAGGQPGDALAPVLSLVNAAYAAVPITGGTAPDGRNATLTYAGAVAGTYYLTVASTGTAGDYVLAVDGATAAAPPLAVTSVAPAKGALLDVAPTAVTVTFSAPFDARGLTPSVLSVDGTPATAVTQLTATSATFTVAAVTAQGAHTVTVGGGLTALGGGPLAAYAGTFTLDTVPPTVVASSVTAGATVPAGPLTYTATFSEPMLAANLDAADVTLVGKLAGLAYTPASVAFSANNTVLTVAYASLPEDAYTLTLLTGAGHFQDAAGNNLAASYAVPFDADAPTRAVGLSTSAGPFGSLVYSGSASGAVSTAVDTDAFTVPLAAGQTLAVVDQATSAALVPTVSLAGPGGATAGTASAPAGGGAAVLQAVTAATAGTYTFTVGGGAGTVGDYSLLFYLDAAVEAETYGGAADNTPATAQDVTAAMVPVPGTAGVTRGAVVGSLDSTVTGDVYAVDLAAGTTSSFTVASPGVTLRVTDAAGDVLATGTAVTGPTASGGTLTATQVGSFTAAAAGPYYVQVTGTAVEPYVLVATTGSAFQADPGTLSPNPAQPIDPTDVVLGGLSSPSDAGLYRFAAVAGATLTLSSLTPGPADTLGVRVQLYDPSGNLVADNVGGAADGRNALLTYAVPTTGLYQARVSPYATGKVAASSEGEYLLAVTADKHPAPAPSAPALSAAADTGASAADRVTRFNDATAATALQFVVPGTVAGDTVEVFIDGKLAGTAVANGVTTTVTATAGTPLADGSHAVTARQVDPAAGESVDSPATTVTVHTATPATPAAPVLQPASDSGTVGDGITTVTAPAFTVAVSTPYFRFYVDGAQVSGNYAGGTTFAVPATLKAGPHTFAVAAVDVAGNVSAAGPVATVTIVAPPAAPTGLQLDPASDTGVSNADGITSTTTPTFDVTAAGPGTLHLAVDGTTGAAVTLAVPSAGTYSVPFPLPSTFAGYAASSVYAGTSVDSTATADVYGNGLTDLVVGSEVQSGLTVLQGNGNGTFTNSTTLTVTGGFVESVAAADLNGDGHVDLIAATSSAGVQVFWGSAGGVFSAPTVLSPGTTAYKVVVGDFNGDGLPDLAAIDGGVVEVYRNAGNRAFAAPVTVATPGTPFMMAAGDLNGDGRADLVVANQNGDAVSVVLATGNGTFGAATTIASPNVADGVAIGDVNGDGIPDVVSLAYFGDTVTPYLGKGDGTFTAGTPVAAGAGPEDLALADLNGDGKLDVAVENVAGGGNAISYLLGTGTGTFAPRVVAAAASYTPYGISTGDFNGDGRPDLAYANFGGTTASVLLATATGVADGTHTFAAWETDAAGDASATVATTLTLDRVAPAVPAAPTLTAASDSGASSTDGVTDVTTPTFTVPGGGPYFRVYRNGALVSAAYATGTTFTSAPLADGTYTFTVASVDAAGNASAAGPAETVTVDTVIPTAPPAPALTAASDSGVSQTDGLTNVNTPTLAVAVAAPYFRVYRNGTLVSGTYATGTTFTSAALADGTYTFAVAAVDAAGNVSALGPATTVVILTQAFGAAAAGPDPTFGTGGSAGAAIAGLNRLTGLAVGADGRVVAVGNVGPTTYPPTASLGIARFTAAGTIDPTLGTAGTATALYDTSDQPLAVAVQPDGKVLVAGEQDHTTTPGSWTTTGFVARYNVDGSLDTSFATGGIYLGSGGAYNGIALQPDGRIVLAGSYALTRLTAAGTPDPTFAGTGTVTLPRGEQLFAVALQSDGRIVASGFGQANGVSGFAVARYTAAGAADPTFGTAGVTVTPYGSTTAGTDVGYAVAVQPDGGIVVAGLAPLPPTSSYNQGAVLRYTSAGALDTTFAGTGITLAPLGTGNDQLTAVVVRPDGHVVVGGDGATGAELVEYNADGTVTTAFGAAGVLTLHPTAYGASVSALVLQPDGRLLVGGTAATTSTGTATEFAVSRVTFPTALSAPSLSPDSDSGTVGDGITDVSTPTLTFAVPAGYYARVYRNGTLVSGTYLAGGTFTSAALADGTYSFGYAVVDAAGNVSALSPAVAVTVDTTKPTATLAAVSNTAGAATETVTFSEPVYGLTPAAFTLTRNGGPNLLDGSQTLTTADHVHYTLGNLAGFDAYGGTYSLAVVPAGVTDVAGNALAAGTSVSWVVDAGLSATADGQAFYFRLDATGTVVQVWETPAAVADPTAAAPTATFPAASFDGTYVRGQGHAGLTVTVDDSNGLVPTDLPAEFFDGGTGASGDALVVRLPAGGGTANVGQYYVTAGTGTGTPTEPLAYVHLASIVVQGTAAADQFTINSPNVPAVTFNGGGGGDQVGDYGGGPVTLVPGTYARVEIDSATPTRPSLVTLPAGPPGGGIGVVDLGAVDINGGSTLAVATAAAAADRTLLVVGAINLTGGGTVDLGGNDLVVRNGSAYAASLVATGFANGTWAGPGLASSAAAADPAHLRALGVLANRGPDGTSPVYATFDGVSVAAADVLVKYTYYGDLNLDGVVNGADYLRIDAGYVTGLTGWANGDLNGDGVVDGSDYTLMDNAFDRQPAPMATAAIATPTAAAPAARPAAEVVRATHGATRGAATAVPPPAWSAAGTPAGGATPAAGASAADLLRRLRDAGGPGGDASDS